MADAPKSEGSSWGAFEIGIIILIVLALFSRNSVENSTSKKIDSGGVIEEANYFCGLQVTSPTQNTVVSSSFTLRGIIEGCYWNIKDGKVISYQVIDDEGSPVSDFVVVKQKTEIFPYVFEETISLSVTPKTSKGYLLLISPSPDSENKTVSVRIPIRFK